MWYEEVKIYHDGSHYVGIPHTENKRKKRPKPQEKVFVVSEEAEKQEGKGTVRIAPTLPTLEIVDDDDCPDCPFDEETEVLAQAEEELKKQSDEAKIRKPKTKRATRKGEFERFYEESKEMTKAKRKKFLIGNLRQYFQTEIATEYYVEKKLQDKKRALIARRLRFMRKAYMHEFNYFVTFTYDNQKHTEETFRKKLLNCLRHLHTRKSWKYMGVWERAPKTGRLHFHGLLEIPNGTMPGELVEAKDYNVNTKRMQVTVQNTYFNKQFGRSDFEEIEKNPVLYTSAITYILKYIEKTGEKLVYSRGTPTYLISDIHEADVIARMGEENEKLLLADNFTCWKEGECIGKIGTNTKKHMKTSN